MLQRRENLTSDNMRALLSIFILIVGLSMCCLAQKPEPCSSPLLLSGGLSLSTQSDKLVALAKYSYDALGKRIRLREFRTFDNRTYFDIDVLLLYRQGVLYKINRKNHTCLKKHLIEDFHPLAVPKDASLVDQVVLGSSSVPGEGILVNTWTGEVQLKKGTARYMSTVTEIGCIPVSTLFSIDRREWVAASFFNNLVGVVDPGDFTPPPFCDNARLMEDDRDSLAAFDLF